MRPVLIAAAAAAGLLMASAGDAQESFFNKRFCSVPGGTAGSILDCSYDTWEQCRGGLTGSTRYCAENPNWRGDAARRRAKARNAARR